MPTTNPKSYDACTRTKVAFLGLGVMGFPMAGHLALAGHEVTVYNRTATKSVAWCADFAGAKGLNASNTFAETPRLAVQGADLVFCCVGNDEDLRSVVLGQDAPVSGGQAGAQNGMLTVMCGGDQVAFEAAKPVAMAFSRAFTLLGSSGAGQLAKMVNQICIAGLVQGLSEAVAFGQLAGLDMNQVLDVIGKGAAQSWQLDNRGKTMVADKFDFGFAVDWMRKDLGLVLDEAKRNGARLPVTALVDQFYADIQHMGGNRWDTSSLVKRLK